MAGSMQYTVQRHQPWRKVVLAIMLVCLAVAAGYGLFYWGRQTGGYHATEMQKLIDGLSGQVEETRTLNTRLIEKHAMLAQGSQIDRSAHDSVKASLQELQQESRVLREELAFYQTLLSPAALKPGLHINRFELVDVGDASGYNYRLVLSQSQRDDLQATGVIKVEVKGVLEGKSQTYSLGDISPQPELNFGFRYFQRFEGELKLPQGFKPGSVLVAARPKSKHLKPVRQSFKWNDALVEDS